MLKNISLFSIFLISVMFCACDSKTINNPPDKSHLNNITNLTATPGNGEVELTWIDPSAEDLDYIEITWIPDGTSSKKIIPGKQSFIAAGLRDGIEYTFTCKSIFKDGEESADLCISAKIDNTIGPASISNLSAIVGDQSILLTWTNPTGSSFERIEISSISGDGQCVSIPKDSQSYQVQNLTNGTNYSFMVQTVDSSQHKSRGITIVATPWDNAPPASVTGLSALASDSIIELNWIDPKDSDFNRVEITWEPDGKSIQIIKKGSQTYTAQDLVNGAEYIFTIKAIDNNGNASSTTISATPLDNLGPAQVTGLIARAGDSSIELSWIDPSNIDFDHIEISWSPDGNLAQKISKDAETFIIYNLVNGTEYNFIIKTVDIMGNTSSGATVVAKPMDITPPAEITGIQVQAHDGTAVLTWNDPIDADFDYIEISRTPGEALPVKVQKGGKMYVARNLSNGSEYTFIVKTVDVYGNKSAGRLVNARPADTIAPGNIINVKAKAVNAVVLLQWDDPSDGDFDHVEITWTPGGGTSRQVMKNTKSYLATGLTNNREYIFTIVSCDAWGNKSSGVIISCTPNSEGQAQWANSMAATSSYHDYMGADFLSVSEGTDGMYAVGYTQYYDKLDLGNSVYIRGQFKNKNLLIVKYSNDGRAQWAKTAAIAPDESVFYSVSAGPEGIYAVGYLIGTGTYWLDDKIYVKGPSSNLNSLIVKYDLNGNVQWAKCTEWNGSGDSCFSGVSTGPDGVYAVGYKFGSVLVIIKYNFNGTVQWTKSTNTSSELSSIHVGNDGVYAAGSYEGRYDPIFENSTPSGNSSYIIASRDSSCTYYGTHPLVVKYDFNGKALWAKTAFRDPNASKFTGISAGSDGVYAVGYLTGHGIYNFGNSKTINAQSYCNDSSYTNLLIVKYTKNGETQWVKTTADNANSQLETKFNGVSIDATGIYAVGYSKYYNSILNFGNSITSQGSCSLENNFIVKLDHDGNALWAKGTTGTKLGNPASALYNGVCAGMSGTYVVGSFYNQESDDEAALDLGNSVTVRGINYHQVLMIVKF